jgi:hypothetical protein
MQIMSNQENITVRHEYEKIDAKYAKLEYVNQKSY